MAACATMCRSASCSGATVEGASHIKSVALVVFGNAITSRMLSCPSDSATIRSSPRAIPPCGGAVAESVHQEPEVVKSVLTAPPFRALGFITRVVL